ncbi:MAG: electron transport complex subunit RsxC [Melioribacteraceae bacterium]|nr:electron transport complex subunit RsxC [Melioribacteraceae bacterium]MCF8354837.1 electron transport complex subunit RsxC [Melioribacteraceae bacterium]MCF8394532.1 electron transport complex subunit RsxC [Melioribacteraceae bacterium]MCF8420191.1 electron transport complex subunit RsxC [Melioribacteraceae bacterium]
MNLFQKAKTFRGGIHPGEAKELSENSVFETMPNPAAILIPLQHSAGKAAKPLVKKGDDVKCGQLIAEPDGFISAPIHSPVSGKVTKITPAATVGGFPKDTILITPAETNEYDFMETLNPDKVTPAEIKERVKQAGIVGKGGAAFPTYVKLSPPEDKKIDVIILNGCECEPYLTRDYRFMIERTNEVVSGLQLIMKAIGVDKGSIGIEDNKPGAIAKLKEAVKFIPNITVDVVKTKYPQGAEKMLIKAVTNREVPPGKLPMDVGVVIQNIGTAIAVHDAVVKGEPEITAALTVSGKGINQPKNLIVRVGTPLSDVIEYCGGVNEYVEKVVVGGPMMGVAQFDFSAPIQKATSGLLVLTEDEINAHEETPCLKCGMCVDVCPLGLEPTKLARLSKLDRLEEAEKLDITVCMECGTCTYTCPANIPLVQWIRLGKQRVMTMQRERKSA